MPMMRYAPHTHNTENIRDAIHYGALDRMGLPSDTRVAELNEFEREDYKRATWEESVEIIDNLRQAIDTVLVNTDESLECSTNMDDLATTLQFNYRILERTAYPDKYNK